MTPSEAIDFGRDGITVLLTVVTPIMAVGMAVGITIALFQSLTQIQEMTLVFVPKILAVFLSLLVLLPFILSTLSAFMDRVALQIIGT